MFRLVILITILILPNRHSYGSDEVRVVVSVPDWEGRASFGISLVSSRLDWSPMYLLYPLSGPGETRELIDIEYVVVGDRVVRAGEARIVARTPFGGYAIATTAEGDSVSRRPNAIHSGLGSGLDLRTYRFEALRVEVRSARDELLYRMDHLEYWPMLIEEHGVVARDEKGDLWHHIVTDTGSRVVALPETWTAIRRSRSNRDVLIYETPEGSGLCTSAFEQLTDPVYFGINQLENGLFRAEHEVRMIDVLSGSGDVVFRTPWNILSSIGSSRYTIIGLFGYFEMDDRGYPRRPAPYEMMMPLTSENPKITSAWLPSRDRAGRREDQILIYDMDAGALVSDEAYKWIVRPLDGSACVPFEDHADAGMLRADGSESFRLLGSMDDHVYWSCLFDVDRGAALFVARGLGTKERAAYLIDGSGQVLWSSEGAPELGSEILSIN